MGAMAEEIVFEPEPFVETCNRLYSKWKVLAVSERDMHERLRASQR